MNDHDETTPTSAAEEGQATVEYVLVILAAAAIAVALITWATTTGMLPGFFDSVMRKVIGYTR